MVAKFRATANGPMPRSSPTSAMVALLGAPTWTSVAGDFGIVGVGHLMIGLCQFRAVPYGIDERALDRRTGCHA